jgi:hypothetical protein
MFKDLRDLPWPLLIPLFIVLLSSLIVAWSLLRKGFYLNYQDRKRKVTFSTQWPAKELLAQKGKTTEVVVHKTGN